MIQVKPAIRAPAFGRDCLISGTLLAGLDLPPGLKAEALGNVALKGHDHDTAIFAVEPA